MRPAEARLSAALCGLGAMLAVITTAAAQGVFARGDGGLVATAALLDDQGRPADRVRANADFRIVLAFREALQDKPAANLKPAAWVRRRAPGSPSCANAAWIVRATGAISSNDIPLERSYLVSVGNAGHHDTEDRLRVVDLDYRLKSADQISVTPLGGRVRDFFVHPLLPRAFALREESGDILAVDLPWGGRSRFADGLQRPSMMAPLGADIVVADHADHDAVGEGRLVRLDATGARRAIHSLSSAVVALVRPNADTVMASGEDGAGLLLGARDAPVRRLPARSLIPPLAANGNVVASTGPRQDILVRWLDDLDRTLSIPVGLTPDGLFVRHDGRYVVAWSTRQSGAVIVDVARARVVATVTTDAVVDEVAAAGSAIFLTHRGASTVTVVDMAPMADAAAPVTRRVRLPVPDDREIEAGRGRVAVSAAMASILTVRPGSNVAFAVAAGGGLSDAPMATVTIRGDLPRMIARFDRRLMETSAGRFEANLRLAAGGTYEIVSTTGVGGTTLCSGFVVDGPGAGDDLPAALRMTGPAPQAGVPATLALSLDNRPGWLRTDLLFIRVDDLAFGWSRRVAATLADESDISLPLTFPKEGRYAISVEAAAGRIAPLVVDVAP